MPNLYRRVQVVMSDGATYFVPTATRLVTNMMMLERDTANHPVFLVGFALCPLPLRALLADTTRERVRIAGYE